MAPGRSDDGTPSGAPAASPNACRLALPVGFGLLGGIPFGLAAHRQLGVSAVIAAIALLSGSLSLLLVWPPQFKTSTGATPSRIPITDPTSAWTHIVRRLGCVGVFIGVWWSSTHGSSLLWATVIGAAIGVVAAVAAVGQLLSVRTFAPMGLVAGASRVAWSSSGPGLGWVPGTMPAAGAVVAIPLSTGEGDQGDRIARRGSGAIAAVVQYLRSARSGFSPSLPRGSAHRSPVESSARLTEDYDVMHTNERGAELVAETMFPHITAALAGTAPTDNSFGDSP